MKLVLTGVFALALMTVLPSHASAQCGPTDARCNATMECYLPGATMGRWFADNTCADPNREEGTPCFAYKVATGEQVMVVCEESAPAP